MSGSNYEVTASEKSAPENHVDNEDTATSFDPKGVRVLAVDDNIVCLNVLLAMLKKCDYKSTGTTHMAGALQLLKENKDDFDIVITDAQTPSMEDFYLLENLSSEFDIPILVVSASEESDHVMKAVKCGAKDFISKPPRLAVIKNIWQHVLRKSLSSDHSKPCIASKDDDEANESKSDSESKCSNLEKKQKKKNVRINWTGALHKKFVEVCEKLGKDAKPKQILLSMNEPGLTIQKISNHLQIYKRSRLRNDSIQIYPFTDQKPSPLNHSSINLLKQKLLCSRFMKSKNQLQQSYNSIQELHLAPHVPYSSSGGGDVNNNLPLQAVYGVADQSNVSRMDGHSFFDVSSQFASSPLAIMQEQSLAEDIFPISYDQVPMPMLMHNGTTFHCESSIQSTLSAGGCKASGTWAQFLEDNHKHLPIQAPLAGQYEEIELPVYNDVVDFTLDSELSGFKGRDYNALFEDQIM